jgi:hypothetical protein
MLLNPIVMTLCLALLLGFGTYTAFASSSEDDEENSQNEQTQPSQGNQTSQVSLRTFNDRESLFTVQYPSNWTPSAPAAEQVSGPIDIIFFAPVSAPDDVAEVEFIQYAQPSVFSTPREALESEISTLQNDPTVTKFEVERPLECEMYTLNGQPACSIIYEIASPDGQLAFMIVDALTNNGTEYETYYRASFNLFNNYLPTAENMIKSFQTTGSNASTTDFTLSGSAGSSNTTGQRSTNLSSNDFSLG